MKNQVSPPVFTTGVPVPLASAHVSYVQWIVLGEHALPVRSDVAADETMKASPFSASYHWRAICEPTSALFWWSAEMISTFSPLAVAPKSSTAMRAATTDP